uniref:Uncharacterized protein n=1 Tax=Oryzias sinensis TaxID=183150 RepID=A0A8C7Z5Y0_9TELE
MKLNKPIEDLMKRSKALRFYGLMGKRSVTKKPFQFNRRNKGDMFVGLMGRSISSGESIIRETPSEASTEIHVAEKPYSKGMIQLVQNLRLFFYVHLYSGIAFMFCSKTNQKYLKFVLFVCRFTRGMDSNPLLMEPQKHLYNCTPTKDKAITSCFLKKIPCLASVHADA